MNDIGTPDRDGYYFQTGNERRWFVSLKDAKAAAQAVADASDCSVRIWHGLTSKIAAHPTKGA